MSALTSLRVVFVGAAALSLSACGINSVPAAEENVNARWADVETSYQRRADLIPNLVASVRGAAGSEQQILREVTEARASANQINLTDDQLSDPAAMARFAEAQSRLTVNLQRLQEAYPNLQSQGRFADLMTSLEGTENQVNVARVRYNEAVQAYNTEIRTFPSIIGAKIIHGAKPKVPFEAAAGAEVAPQINLENIGGAPAQPAPAVNDNAPAADQPAAAAN